MSKKNSGAPNPKINTPVPPGPFPSEDRFNQDFVGHQANRAEGRPDDPTDDEPETARPAAARVPYKNLKSY